MTATMTRGGGDEFMHRGEEALGALRERQQQLRHQQLAPTIGREILILDQRNNDVRRINGLPPRY
jgi:hypothetical protein